MCTGLQLSSVGQLFLPYQGHLQIVFQPVLFLLQKLQLLLFVVLGLQQLYGHLVFVPPQLLQLAVDFLMLQLPAAHVKLQLFNLLLVPLLVFLSVGLFLSELSSELEELFLFEEQLPL